MKKALPVTWLRRGIFCGAVIGAGTTITIVGYVGNDLRSMTAGIFAMLLGAVLQELFVHYARKDDD